MPKEDASIEEISEEIENYCLNKAMDDAQKSPLLSRKEALDYRRKRNITGLLSKMCA